MKNYLVKATINFNDMEEKTENTIENTQIDIEKEPPYKKYPRFKDWIFRLVLFGVGLIGLELITIVIQFCYI